MSQYKKIIMGGTFDHLHLGHKKLIDTGLRLGDKLIIGLTTKNLYQEKLLLSEIESYEVRLKALTEYIKSQKAENKVEIVPITDIFGTSISDPKFEAIIVSPDTQKNAEKINLLRKENQIPPLIIISVPFVTTATGKKITSEQVRQGVIDSQGFEYLGLFQTDKKLLLPTSLRDRLREPLGEIWTENHQLVEAIRSKNPTMLVTVGDIVTQTLEEYDGMISVAVTDGKTRRTLLGKASNTKIQYQQTSVENPPGMINNLAIVSLQSVFDLWRSTKQTQRLQVNGEEDLLTLPAVLLAPLGAVVVYGQYQTGAIVVDVTIEKKNEVRKIIESFEKR